MELRGELASSLLLICLHREARDTQNFPLKKLFQFLHDGDEFALKHTRTHGSGPTRTQVVSSLHLRGGLRRSRERGGGEGAGCRLAPGAPGALEPNAEPSVLTLLWGK